MMKELDFEESVVFLDSKCAEKGLQTGKASCPVGP